MILFWLSFLVLLCVSGSVPLTHQLNEADGPALDIGPQLSTGCKHIKSFEIRISDSLQKCDFYSIFRFNIGTWLARPFPLSSLHDEYEQGSRVTVKCLKGHVINDNTSANEYESICQTDGKWSPVFTCEPLDCGIPKTSDVVKLTNTNAPTTYREQISFKCISEYYQLSKNVEKQMIYEGDEAKLGQIPWQLYISYGNKFGGASLINDYWALTAAHVVYGHTTSELSLKGGMVNKTSPNFKELTLEKIIIHPKYENSPTNFDNDIALIKTSTRVSFSDNLRPVCLPKESHEPVLERKMGTISGFGQFENSPKPSDTLRFGEVWEYSIEKCKGTLTVSNNMFCAGNEQKFYESCPGDSGGPLVFPLLGFSTTEQPYELRGIVSWGPTICGSTIYKSYYTKVQNYLDWIKTTIAKN